MYVAHLKTIGTPPIINLSLGLITIEFILHPLSNNIEFPLTFIENKQPENCFAINLGIVIEKLSPDLFCVVVFLILYCSANPLVIFFYECNPPLLSCFVRIISSVIHWLLYYQYSIFYVLFNSVQEGAKFFFLFSEL